MRPLTTCLLFLLLALPGFASLNWTTPKKHTIHVRLLAQLPAASLTATARNSTVFVAKQRLHHGEYKLIKLSYDRLFYEPPFPYNPHAIYKLRVFRDDEDSCDESLGSLTRELGLKADSAAASTIVECWHTTPQDYKSRKIR